MFHLAGPVDWLEGLHEFAFDKAVELELFLLALLPCVQFLPLEELLILRVLFLLIFIAPMWINFVPHVR